jgi:hypothetical protein
MVTLDVSSNLAWSIAAPVVVITIFYGIKSMTGKRKSRLEYWQLKKDHIQPSRPPQQTEERKYLYFDDVELRDGVAIIRFNGPGKVNTISKPMIEEAQKIFNEAILPNRDVRAVVFMSSKKDNFIAGADIDALQAVEDKSILADMCSKGHDFFDFLKTVSDYLQNDSNGSYTYVLNVFDDRLSCL